MTKPASDARLMLTATAENRKPTSVLTGAA
jgi:hypothetical protein